MIDYTKIAKAVEHYKSVGYTYIDVPWIVDRKYVNLTLPSSRVIHHVERGANYIGALVGSGEQSFLSLIASGQIKQDRPYVCVTPCFRDEETYDDLHQEYFMKVELIHASSFLKDKIDRKVSLDLLIDDAFNFFLEYLPAKIKKTEDGFDILSRTGIELGSYGIRYDDGLGYWIYGTGCAEPRLSLAIEKDGQNE